MQLIHGPIQVVQEALDEKVDKKKSVTVQIFQKAVYLPLICSYLDSLKAAV